LWSTKRPAALPLGKRRLPKRLDAPSKAGLDMFGKSLPHRNSIAPDKRVSKNL